MSFKIIGIALLVVTTISVSHARKVTVRYPAIYPFVPFTTETIYSNVTTVTEDTRFIKNFRDMTKKYSEGKAKEQPWTSSYWPLTKGTIADPYENSMLEYNLDLGWVAWKGNYRNLVKRQSKVHPTIKDMDQEDLDKLAASEKYDLLLGDESFDLTKRLVDHMGKWGSAKVNSFITKIGLAGDDSLELARNYVSQGYYPDVDNAFANSWNLKTTLSAKYALELVQKGKFENAEDAFSSALKKAEKEASNYVLNKQNSRMAAWEGICNGWSTGAGLVPRPRKVVSFTMDNGKKLNFYPADIKGLISLYYVNSLIQDNAMVDPETKLPTTQGTVSAGLRCNQGAKKDLWGRKYDSKADQYSNQLQPRCVGVHPAIWHLGLVNLLGKQQRSFVVERKVGPAVDNHPMASYKMRYFHPNEESSKYYEPMDEESRLSMNDVIVKIDEEDQFKQFRNKKAVYVVGVETEISYMNYKRPSRDETDSEEDDAIVEKKMLYDLELDLNYNIVGGQWRTKKVGQPSGNRNELLNHNQPDFFWTITKDYKSVGWFNDEKEIAEWSDRSKLPPKSWLAKAQSYHSFEYKNTLDWNPAPCKLKHKKKKDYIDTSCAKSVNKPQPLINIVNELVRRSK